MCPVEAVGAMIHETLKRKIGEARGARPPLRDPNFVSDLFARLLEERLRVSFSMPVGVGVQVGSAAKLSEALKAEGAPALYGVAETPAGRLGGVLTFSAPLVHRVVAAMTGAAQGGSADPERMPTAIDEALVHGFADDVIDCFERAVISGPRPEAGVALFFRRFARRATSLAEAPDAMDTIAFRIEIGFAEETPPLTLDLILPLSALDLYRAAEKDTASRPPLGRVNASGEIWASAMLSAARTAEYRFVGVLAELTLTVEEVAALVPGSVLLLPEERKLEVSLRVDRPGGVAGRGDLARGALGAAEGRRAVKITAPPAPAFTENLLPYMAED